MSGTQPAPRQWKWKEGEWAAGWSGWCLAAAAWPEKAGMLTVPTLAKVA